MGRTVISIHHNQFLLNGKPTYAEIPGVRTESVGLLWNQRLIQGVFDDASGRAKYNQLAVEQFDPEKNTDALIAALPEWYAYGLRAITVGFQGGWPVTMFENPADMETIDNNPFGADGKRLDPAYAARMDRLIRGADEAGLVVIVNIFYWAQAKRFQSGQALVNALRVACDFIKAGGYTNVMIDLANEYCIRLFEAHPLVNSEEGMAHLIELAKEWSGVPVGASSADAMVHPQVIAASDYVLIHGNALTRGEFFQYATKIRSLAGDKPVVCNEDSPCFTRIDVAMEAGVSWGYYNNYTKQIPPCHWGITKGEDLFFARRMARAIGIPVAPLAREDQIYLQGLEPWNQFGNGLRVLRVTAEYPEQISCVRFYLNGELMDISYDEPFFLYTECTWLGKAVRVEEGDVWTAEVIMTDGTRRMLG